MVSSKKETHLSIPLWGMAWRAFFLQACWNFQRMQNLGFAFAMIPLVRILAKDKAEQVAMLRRHLEFFNTHPYCATLILGVVARLEVDMVGQEESKKESIHRIKTGMMGPLAALGDTVFWAMLKPAAALVGVGFVILTSTGGIWPALLGPVLFLTIFSIPHIGLHFGGIKMGYAKGVEIAHDLRRFNPQLIARRVALFIMVALGAVAAIYIFRTMQIMPGVRWINGLILLGATGLFYGGLRKGVPATVLIYGLAGLVWVLAVAGMI